MRLLLWLALFLILAQFSQAGLFRRYVRRNRSPRISHGFPSLAVQRRSSSPFRIARAINPKGVIPFPSFMYRRMGTKPSSRWMSLNRQRRRVLNSPWSHHRRNSYFSRAQRRVRTARRFPFSFLRRNYSPNYYSRVPITYKSYTPRPYGRNQMTGYDYRMARTRTWSPMQFGSAIFRNPTLKYAPPAIERFSMGRSMSYPATRTRRRHSGRIRPSIMKKKPIASRPLLWKMLHKKQRRRRPVKPNIYQRPNQFYGHSYRPQFYGNKPARPYKTRNNEGVLPNLENVVYFRPTDVVGQRNKVHENRKTNGNKSYKTGSVATVPLYSKEVTSMSEFKPVYSKPDSGPAPTGYKFTVVGYSTPESPNTFSTTTKKTEIVKDRSKELTPEVTSTTHTSVEKPVDPTESMKHKSSKIEAPKPKKDVGKPKKDIAKPKKDVTKPKSEAPVASDGEITEDILSKLDMVPPAPIPLIPNSFNILGSSSEAAAEPKKTVSGPIFSAKRIPSKTSVKKSESVATSTSTSISMSFSDSKENNHKNARVKHAKKQPKKPSSFLDIFKFRKSSTTTMRPTTTSTKRPTTTTEATTIKMTTVATTTPKPTTTTIATTTTTTTTPKPTTSGYARLPNIPVYKSRKKHVPVYNKKKTSSFSNRVNKDHKLVSKSMDSKESSHNSGEIVVITAGRSKVKEYKPQFIANHTQLLSFDTVSTDNNNAKENNSPILLDDDDSASSKTSPSGSTTKSPLQEFDPMKLLHSWFNKS